MEQIGFFVVLAIAIGILGLFVKSLIVVCWNAGEKGANTATSDEIFLDMFNDLRAVVLLFSSKPIATLSAFVVFFATYMLTPVGVFSATGYSVVTYLAIGIVLPRVKLIMKSKSSNSESVKT